MNKSMRDFHFLCMSMCSTPSYIYKNIHTIANKLTWRLELMISSLVFSTLPNFKKILPNNPNWRICWWIGVFKIGFEGIEVSFDGKWLGLRGLEIGESEGFQFGRIGLRSEEKKEGSGFIIFRFLRSCRGMVWACCGMSLKHGVCTGSLSRGMLLLGFYMETEHVATWWKRVAAWLCFLPFFFCSTFALVQYAFNSPTTTKNQRVMYCMTKTLFNYYANKQFIER